MLLSQTMTIWICFFLWLKAVWTVKSLQLRWKKKMGILQELSTFDGDVEGCSSTGSWVYSHSETFWVGLSVGYIYPSLCYRICPFSSWFLFTTWSPRICVVLIIDKWQYSTCLELAAIAKDVGLPPGVLNIVTGLGPDAGAPLASHTGIDKVILLTRKFLYFANWSLWLCALWQGHELESPLSIKAANDQFCCCGVFGCNTAC